MKKLIASILCVLIVLIVSTSISASAKETNYFGINNAEITATDSGKFTFAEINTLSDGLRQTINDTCGESKGCKVTVHFKYSGISRDSAQLALAVNYKYVHSFYQIVETNDNSATFDWDTIKKNLLPGNIFDITLGTNQSIVVTGVDVYVPKLVSLSAGAGCEDLAVPMSFSIFSGLGREIYLRDIERV